MAENGEDTMQAAEPQVRLQILAQYIRDMSFENVVAQKGFDGGEITPDIEVQVSLDGRQRPVENQYEVVMKFQITSKNQADQANLFLLELEYGGIFQVEGVPEDQLHPFLLIECPRQLFPFVRRIVSDVTSDGGFPQLNLDNIDFVDLYRQQMQAQQGMPTQA
ncbi:preprotein translocase subunit SecB [Defluviimonas sp. 20V17]|uniref:Protein-export protein SecB n=1 Tax=Allgaiera indica TaxID=765699 RepID=A0AAN4UN77_9RHOB|nr:protein-export chaperone SecB [Allgaiera indica]KDB03623.1 preprotein translocase subunit SecB [Defluviimonas sp. 20V17]GHD98264.1 protein-export protein SecB [Allgaiera indica]SDW50509.1 protein translocase subunit secB [Allgaiera indica]